MPPKRGEDAQSYLKRIQQELKDAKKQALKEQRAKRNELIKKVGKLFVDKCKKDSVEYYADICESEAFADMLFAYNSTDVEVNTAAETDRENNSVVEANVGAAVETKFVV